MSWSEPQPQAGFSGRLRARLLDPINAVIPPLIAVFCLARPSGLIAEGPMVPPKNTSLASGVTVFAAGSRRKVAKFLPIGV